MQRGFITPDEYKDTLASQNKQSGAAAKESKLPAPHLADEDELSEVEDSFVDNAPIAESQDLNEFSNLGHNEHEDEHEHDQDDKQNDETASSQENVSVETDRATSPRQAATPSKSQESTPQETAQSDYEARLEGATQVSDA